MDTNENLDRFRAAVRHAFDSGWEACEAFRGIPDTKIESKIVITGEGIRILAKTVDQAGVQRVTSKIPTRLLDILKEEPPTPVPHHWYRNRTARFLSAIDQANS